MYKKLTHQYQGVLTGKGLEFGGSRIRPEATGFGALYFVNQMMATRGLSLKGKTVAISGFGSVTMVCSKLFGIAWTKKRRQKPLLPANSPSACSMKTMMYKNTPQLMMKLSNVHRRVNNHEN